MARSAAELRKVVSVILGGGRGTRLLPLTERRAKPAVSFGGKYRLIDIPISNSINSDIRKIFVLTQFLSAGLHSHINRTYRMDGFSDGFVEILAAEQTQTSKTWFQGTADAVRHGLRYLLRTPAEHVLILAGDQLYHMDFRTMLETHLDAGADLTLAATLVAEPEVPRMGILRVDGGGSVIDHVEKPEARDVIESLRAPGELRARLGDGDPARAHLGSMGIFLFRRSALIDLLEEDESRKDLSREVIPAALGRYRVVFHPFDGYWEDVGTLRSFFEANLDLTGLNPKFNLYDPLNPLFSRTRFLPAAKIQNTTLDQALVAEGSIIEGARISRVVIGLRSVVRRGCEIRNSILIGNDSYEIDFDGPRRRAEIGPDTFIENAVIDKNVVIGAGSEIRGRPGEPDRDGPGFAVRDGIVVIPEGTVLPPGTRV
ncbi:MAG: sugar phosphate nucleotidyltransferase [Candidatus Eisenbacteria bacterium]